MASRLRSKLAKLLQAELQTLLGGTVAVDPQRLIPATGWYRTSPQADCYRWEGFFTWNGQLCSVDSWDTMTDCCKQGITIRRDRAVMFEAYAKEN